VEIRDYKHELSLFIPFASLEIRIAMKQNFIIALDHGQAFDTQDGRSGTSTLGDQRVKLAEIKTVLF